MNTEDLRVKRTRRLLRKAFVQLVIEQGYDRLTIREITTRAQVGHKTFYRHYESKAALLHAILSELINEVRQTLERSPKVTTPYQNTITALKFTQTNADLFLALMQSPVADMLLEPLLQTAVQEGSLFIDKLDVPSELATHYFASSLDSLIKWWLKNDMPYSVEEMATYIERLVIEPVAKLQDGV